MSKIKADELKNPAIIDSLTELLRTGARRLIAEAVELELEGFLSSVSESLNDGKARVVRKGHLPAREIMTGIGKVEVQVPRVRDRGKEKEKIIFKSSLIPPYLR